MKLQHAKLTAPLDFEQSAAHRWKQEVIRTLPKGLAAAEIDLSQTRTIDSNGLTALLAIHDSLHSAGAEARLINPSPVVMQLLEMTHLHRVFNITRETAQNVPGADRPILVAEDETIILSVAELSLKPLGRPVITARNGREAVALARRHLPAAIVLDYIMPLMDGTETLRDLKSDSETRDIPVLVMSANERITRDLQQHFQGAAAFLAKPFNPVTLRSEVNRIIQEHLDMPAAA